MTLNVRETRSVLQKGDLTSLFVEQLGWDYYDTPLRVSVDGQNYDLQPVAHKRGFVVLRQQAGGAMPDYATRRKIERHVAQSHREHLLIFVDGAGREQIWQWVLREPGRPLASREHRFDARQSGEALIQKLRNITFTLNEEADLTLIDVTGRLRAAFNVERATKKFFESFRTERSAFEKFVQGIPVEEMSKWYVSVMLNRLMFVYFIQKKGFLDGDPDYLRNRLRTMQAQHGSDQFYSFYRAFLLRLFHEGLGRPREAHSPELDKLIGKVPYLNGGIFAEHEVEQQFPDIEIADDAFERIFNFFDRYQWHLDDRPLRDDNEINPDVLGYIFEKYINQKQMGAYYTKEDITGYIGRNTILPFLFDQARKECAIAFDGEQSVWNLLAADPDRYIYPAVRKGADRPLPPDIAVGLDDVSRRQLWNTPAPEEVALPTEIWRETVARRQRYEEIRAKLAGGEVRAIDDLITYNLDIQQFAQDVVENSEGPELLRAFWKAIRAVSILDPTCGSGAFLFAALNILEPLYEACLGRMAAFVAELGPDDHPQKYRDFKETLEQVGQHPNETYYILKSIVVNNLYGVDIMPEAVEIAKLRLFLKLAAQVESVDKVEPLPDIDFNIRAGNTLVGFTTKEEVVQAMKVAGGGQQKLIFGEDQAALAAIEEKADLVERLFTLYRRMQTAHEFQAGEAADFVATKTELRRRLSDLEAELNRYLAAQYGVNADRPAEYHQWLHSHEPFHWFVEFYGILKQGGFDVIIGNPPYVEYRLVKKDYTLQSGLYRSESTSNLYAFCMERSCTLLNSRGQFGMIVPSGVLGLDQASCLREVLFNSFALSHCSTYGIRPSKLFEGVDQRLCIFLGNRGSSSEKSIWTTQYKRWHVEERTSLFARLVYRRSLVHSRLDRVPQVGSSQSAVILNKIESHNHKTISSYFSNARSGVLMHYHRSPRYWIRAMDFEQYFKSATRSKSIHHFRDLYFRSKRDAKIVGALLNSSLFFWWFVSVGNGRNITGVDVEQFPVGDLSDIKLDPLPSVFDRLMADYKENSFIRVRKDAEFQEFRPSMSKAIMDELDRYLAHYYGFTDEELDFIINYDIKYRMGDELFEEDGG